MLSMGLRPWFSITALLAATTSAQVVSYTDSGHGLSVNVPSGSSNTIFMQISAPSGTQWVSFGQGSRMAGSQMFIVYQASDSNVTLSPRLSTGHSQPTYSSDIQATLLDGSGVTSSGFVANIRCDSASSWSGGSMSTSSSSSNWIFASKSGSALNSADQSANIQIHDASSSFTLDLTKASGGNSNNPFLAAAASSSSSAPSATSSSSAGTSSNPTSASTSAAGSATQSVSQPLASSAGGQGQSNTGDVSENDSTNNLTSAHGIIMSVVFVGLMPIIALTVYLPTQKKIRWIHAPLQLITLILAIAGMALGIKLGEDIHQIDGYHQIIGYVVVALLIAAQPALGLYQHIHYTKHGVRHAMGSVHRWLGRSLIILGVVNGGIGYNLTQDTAAYIPYGVVAGIVGAVYIAVVLVMWYRGRVVLRNDDTEKNRGYETDRSPSSGHERLSSKQQNTQRRQNGRF